MNPQWSHDVYVTEKKEKNRMKTLLVVVVIAAVGYGLIVLLGPVIR